MSVAEIQDVFLGSNLPLSDQQASQIRAYMRLLLKWNEVVNLTSIIDPHEILVRHFLESALAAKWVNLSRGRLADIGSGAGFPGLALKIFADQLQVTLLESSARKCAFLKEVVHYVELSGVTIVRQRIIFREPAPVPFDFITARAVGDYQAFLPWARASLTREGRILLWVGLDSAAGLEKSDLFVWDAPHFVEGSSRRVILVGAMRS